MKYGRWIQFLAVFALLLSMGQARGWAVNPLLAKDRDVKAKSGTFEAMTAGNVRQELLSGMSNYMTVETGTVRNGEQIPLPRFQDGRVARRDECKYIVSPNEMSTAMTFLGGAGAYFIKCSVDSDGYVHASLYQYDGAGREYDIVADKSYDSLKEYYKTIGTQYPGSEDFRDKLTATAKHKVIANYMVIAIRSE